MLLGKTQDNEGWIRQGKLSVGKNLRDMADSLSDNKVFGATKQVLSQGINNAFNPYAKMAEGRSLSALTPNKKVEYSPFVKIGSDVVNQGLKNYLAGSTFNLIQPKMGEAQTTAGKVSGGISNLVGAFSSPLKKVVWDLPEKGATAVTRKILQNTAPKLAGSTFSRFLPQFNSEVAQTLGYATLSKIGNKLGVNDRTDQFTPKGLTTDLAMGLGFRYAPQLVQNLMGINSKGIMHPEDVTWMDSAIDTLRNKKATPKQVQNAKTILYRLGENYLDKSKLNEGANASLLARQLQKVAGNQVGGGTVPTMGIVDKSQSPSTPEVKGVIPEGKGITAEVVNIKKPIDINNPFHNKLDTAVEMVHNKEVGRYQKALESANKILSDTNNTYSPRDRKWARDFSNFWNGPSIKDANITRLQEKALLTPNRKAEYTTQYIKEVKKAISQGYDIPEDIIKQFPEFKTAIDSRARYEKGYKTSFANRSAGINEATKADYGFKVKRQDGTAIPENQIQGITKASHEFEQAVGPIKDIIDKLDLTVAHTNGKFPFLRSDADGLYHTSDKTITVGTLGIKAFAHELTHAIDSESGTMAKRYGKYGKDASIGDYKIDGINVAEEAKKIMNGSKWEIDRLLKAGKQLTPEQKEAQQLLMGRIGKYFNNDEEVFARLVEQYVSSKVGGRLVGSSSELAEGVNFYHDSPAYWTKENFDKLAPLVERLLGNKISIIREKNGLKLPQSFGGIYQYERPLDTVQPLSSPSIPSVNQPTIKIKPSEKIKISALESKPSKPQLSEQSQTLVKQNLDQPRTLLNTQTDQMKNSVPSSVVEGTPSKVSQPIIPQKYLESVNTTKLKLKPEEKKTLETATNLVKDEIQKVKGKTLSNDEVVKVAKESDILQKVITRDQTLQAEAIQLKARQQMVSLDKEVNELSKQGNSPLLQKKIQELLESIKTVNSNAADKGRQLQALSIDAGDESVRLSILKDISKIETDTEKIIRESANVDWNNANKVAEFYRKFIKPSTMETLDEFRYNNMLSSPRTHIRNAFSNLVQTFFTRPVTLAAQGKFKQTGQYYTGAIKSLPDAVSEFAKAFKGETPIGQQDLKYIPTGKIPKLFTIPSKALEASDKFFTKLISSGEMARGASENEALDTAAYSLFRQGLNPEGQGKLLGAIDSLTSWTYNAPKAVRWFVPFIRTPMNFAKQWVEYSPSGFLTTIGAKNKGEQIAKAFVGSTIMAVGAKFALDNNTTWSAPTDPKEKEIFYASGRKPFSVKIGDKWVSMMYAGPFALAFAVPAAAKYYQEDNRTALTDTQLQKLGKISMSMAEYLSGQTFLEGMNNFVKFFSGDADYTFAKNMGYTAGQVIPMQGLVRWVSGIIDPVYRKATTFGDQIKSGIPGVSKSLPPYLDPTGKPSTREGYNSFTPYDITPDKPQYNKPLEERQDKLQQNAVINKAVKDMESQLQSGTDPKPVQVGNIFILPEEGEIKKIELKQFSLPKKTGDIEKDKKALSSYKSSITAQIKQVDRLIAAGAMPTDQGNELKANLTDLKNEAGKTSGISISGGKKSTKSKGGKLSIKKSTVKLSKLPEFKTPSFGKLGTTSYKVIGKPKIKLSSPKKIVIAKKKSNTIKIKPMPTMKVAKGGFLG